jgi:hypothetical protein
LDLARVPEAQRDALLQRALLESPGVYQAAWFEPAIGYTLRPQARLDAFGDRFTSNELGYRTHPVTKPRGTFRVLLVGDSWTFGLGVREAETFGAQLEALAASHRRGRRPVQVWTLALPGYSTVNELAALDYFQGRLRADAVVLCPTVNDIDTPPVVLPNGSLGRSLAPTDPLGDVHSLRFALTLVDSYKFRSRWRLSFRRIRDLELRLHQRGVPLLLFFVGSWEEDLAHHLAASAGLRSPYLIVPPSLTGGRWRNPPPFRHAAPAAHRLYAEMLYRALGERLGWEAASDLDPRSAVPIHDATRRPGLDVRLARAFRRATAEHVPERYEPGASSDVQCLGPMACATGLMGRATTILVRRRAGASRLDVTLERIAALAHLYPLEVRLSVPSVDGVVSAIVTLRADGPASQTFSVAIPDSVRPGAAIDVTLQASRTAPLHGLVPRSLAVASITQE